jgi:hypothetical protein
LKRDKAALKITSFLNKKLKRVKQAEENKKLKMEKLKQIETQKVEAAVKLHQAQQALKAEKDAQLQQAQIDGQDVQPNPSLEAAVAAQQEAADSYKHIQKEAQDAHKALISEQIVAENAELELAKDNLQKISEKDQIQIAEHVVPDCNVNPFPEQGYEYKSDTVTGILVNKTATDYYVCVKRDEKEVWFDIKIVPHSEKHELVQQSNFVNFTHNYQTPQRHSACEFIAQEEILMKKKTYIVGMRGIKVGQNKKKMGFFGDDDTFVWFQNKMCSPLGQVCKYSNHSYYSETYDPQIDEDQDLTIEYPKSVCIDKEKYVAATARIQGTKLKIETSGGKVEKELEEKSERDGTYLVFLSKDPNVKPIIGDELTSSIDWDYYKKIWQTTVWQNRNQIMEKMGYAAVAIAAARSLMSNEVPITFATHNPFQLFVNGSTMLLGFNHYKGFVNFVGDAVAKVDERLNSGGKSRKHRKQTNKNKNVRKH